jgi:hypothetical protein
LETTKEDYQNINKYINYLNSLDIPRKDNYVSINYGKKYFDNDNALLI